MKKSGGQQYTVGKRVISIDVLSKSLLLSSPLLHCQKLQAHRKVVQNGDTLLYYESEVVVAERRDEEVEGSNPR